MKRLVKVTHNMKYPAQGNGLGALVGGLRLDNIQIVCKLNYAVVLFRWLCISGQKSNRESIIMPIGMVIRSPLHIIRPARSGHKQK